MADALCGPSNALQNFQKHSSVDRTLQQDRLTNRHSPAQGFRSSPGPSAGRLDLDFEAFQAGSIQPPQPDFHLPHVQPQFSQFSQAPQAPDWASDFQRLNIASSHRPPHLQHHQPHQVPNATASWHQDFMRQQQLSLQQTPMQQYNVSGGMLESGTPYMTSGCQPRIGFGAMNGVPLSEVASGKQRAQEAALQVDDAAFEQVFAEIMKSEQPRSAHDEYTREMQGLTGDSEMRQRRHHEALELEETIKSIQEPDPVLAQLRERRPTVYYTIKLRSALELGSPEQELWYKALDLLQQQGTIASDASEARWCVDALSAITQREIQANPIVNIDSLIEQINERLMSEHPFSPMLTERQKQEPQGLQQLRQDLEAAGYRTDLPLPAQREPELREQEPQQGSREPEPQTQQQQTPHDDDEMAETAARLLDCVADNTSQKFQNSQFLSLMRRLANREARVQGDKIVDNVSSPTPPTSTTIPEIDARILSHAAQDFGMPVDSALDADRDRDGEDAAGTRERGEQWLGSGA